MQQRDGRKLYSRSKRELSPAWLEPRPLLQGASRLQLPWLAHLYLHQPTGLVQDPRPSTQITRSSRAAAVQGASASLHSKERCSPSALVLCVNLLYSLALHIGCSSRELSPIAAAVLRLLGIAVPLGQMFGLVGGLWSCSRAAEVRICGLTRRWEAELQDGKAPTDGTQLARQLQCWPL